MEIMEYDEEYRIESLKELVEAIDPLPLALLEFICRFLQYALRFVTLTIASKVSTRSEQNQMSITNLASLVAPNVLYRKVCWIFLVADVLDFDRGKYFDRFR